MRSTSPRRWEAMVGGDPQSRPAGHRARWRSPRSTPRCGISRRACSTCSLVALLGAARDAVAGLRQRRLHLLRRRSAAPSSSAAGRPTGMTRVKMKVGRDPARRSAARRAWRARRSATRRRSSSTPTAHTRASRRWPSPTPSPDCGVDWFEEPVTSDDLDGLRLMRDRAPAGMDIAAGEYGYDLPYFRRMLEAGRWTCCRPMRRAAPASPASCAWRRSVPARSLPLSSHCAPALHLHVAAPRRTWCMSSTSTTSAHRADALRRRARPRDGVLRPDRSRPGIGLELRRADARALRGGGMSANGRPPRRVPSRAMAGSGPEVDARALAIDLLQRGATARSASTPAVARALRHRRLELPAGADRRRGAAQHGGGRAGDRGLPRRTARRCSPAAAARASPASAATWPSSSTSASTSTASSSSTRSAGARASSRASCSTSCATQAERHRPDLRTGSGDAQPLHARRDDRQQFAAACTR